MRRDRIRNPLLGSAAFLAALALAACSEPAGVSDLGSPDGVADTADGRVVDEGLPPAPDDSTTPDTPAPDLPREVTDDVPQPDLPGETATDVPQPDLPGETATDVPPSELPEVAPDATDVPPPDDLPSDALSDVLPEVTVPPCAGDPGVAPWPTTADSAFLRGPYVQDVRGDHAVIVFRPAVSIDAQGCVDWRIQGTHAPTTQDCVAPDEYGQYAIRIGGLPPDTGIDYSVSLGGSLSAGPFTFLSAPMPDRPQRILFMSDIHANREKNTTILSKIVSQALAAGVDFAMTCGDHVDKPEETQFDDLFDGLRSLLHRVPVFTAIGNHEGRNPNYFEAFVLPEADPPDPESGEMYYSFRRGNVWIAALEIFDWQLSWTFGETLGQVEWLTRELDSEAARSARWRLLVIHQPPWGKNWKPCDPESPNYGEQSLRDLLVPLARDKGVSAIFSGHFHDYEHGVMDGVQLFVTGGGGGGMEISCPAPDGMPQPWTEAITYHSLTVETGCDALSVVATDIDGLELDRVIVPYAGN